MGIFDGIMILSDMDGTLLRHQQLHPEQLRAVQYFTDNGGLFCPATGRAEHFLQKNFPELELNTYCIVKNGTAIYDPASDSFVWKCVLDNAAIYRAIELCRVFPEIDLVVVHLEREMLKFTSKEIQQLLQVDEPIFKIVLHTPPNLAAKFAESCKENTDYQYICSTNFLLEILPCQAGKGACAEQIRTLMGERVRCMIGIGDYDNDISLLQATDIAVAVRSNCLALQEYADWIAPPIEEHPMRWLVEKIEKELCK